MTFWQDAFSNSKAHSHMTKAIKISPRVDHKVSLPVVPQLQTAPKALALRVAAMFKVLVSMRYRFYSDFTVLQRGFERYYKKHNSCSM